MQATLNLHIKPNKLADVFQKLLRSLFNLNLKQTGHCFVSQNFKWVDIIIFNVHVTSLSHEQFIKNI